MSYITAEKLVKQYGEKDFAVMAIKGISFNIEEGEFVAIMGESGSGKSTLLSIMGALNTPTNGAYAIDGVDIYRLNQDQRAVFRREYLGFVFQSFHLVPYLTALENVMIPLTTTKRKAREKRDMAQSALQRVGLKDKGHRLPSEMSGGEQERVAVARAIVNHPPILIADEPTGNLDSKTTSGIMKLIKGLSHKGMTVVMVTHSPECARYAERLIHLSDGLIVDGDTRAFECLDNELESLIINQSGGSSCCSAG
jgi:putative ABC transport system ATP-binding protein